MWKVQTYPLPTKVQQELTLPKGAVVLGIQTSRAGDDGVLLVRETVPVDGETEVRRFRMIGQGRTCDVDPKKLTLVGCLTCFHGQTAYALFEERA